MRRSPFRARESCWILSAELPVLGNGRLAKYLVPEVRTLLPCSSCSLAYRSLCALVGESDGDCSFRQCSDTSSGIFGQRLEDTVQYEKKFGHRLAPLLVEQCVDFIREQGLNEEGLFRMPGQANLVKELQDAFDCGDKPIFDSNTDVHTVASLLKLYLRELPEPVVPFAKYQDFLTCAQLLGKDEEEGIQELMKQVKSLPQANYNLLKYICKFLDEVQSHSSENKMSVQNLATVFGPNILRPKMEDPVTMMEGTSMVQHLMTVLISEHPRLFVCRDREDPLAQLEVRAQGLHSTEGWISEEDLHGYPTTERGANSGDDLDGSSSSLDIVATRLVPQGRGEGESEGSGPGAGPGVVSPSKQVKSLPAWKYSFKGSGSRSNPAKLGLGGSTVDVSSTSGGNWLLNGLSSLRGHRRTSSGERVRDSGSSQRLSTYDNVTSSSLSVPSVASAPWSTSSCDISVPDSTSDLSESTDCGESEGDRGRVEERTSETGDSSEAGLELRVPCGGHSESRDVTSDPVVPYNADNGHSKALTDLVEELREELRMQKLTYETRIRKLEESSAALHVQMEKLENEMDQERKKQRMLEIKLRNSERAREDAENRNRVLQEEMEQFFSTLGDLTLGARTSNI
ncbi:rho GTPase-activating protein 22 isoform X2 [Conger conger]|uniref:rho GTPase-activating protein 22 isoform X2 n=1 Tax=Conger conger TaxID=82655 RepID=UPI002A59D4C4|nr:rho GTPase-activating protein 22 isoform X2 [Conger conger]